MHFTSALTVGFATILACGASAAYTGCDHYNATNFFSEFSFFDKTDPTGGFVSFQNESQANSSSLAGYILAVNRPIFLGVDYKTVNPARPGRGSVRLTSKKTYTQGLFIADIAHMPVGCGVWPAFWTTGPDWPNGGEIDILEGVNLNTNNTVTLHTGEGCVMSGSGSLPTSRLTNPDCGANHGFDGCPTTTSSSLGYGEGFNAIGGGVYAMEWTSAAIAVWFFPRHAIPADILDAGHESSPTPSKWGAPAASFTGRRPGCDIDARFKDHSIVFDTTFCGQWAGRAEVWGSSSCSALAPTCTQYVAETPAAFEDAYWLINKVMVYQDYSAAGSG